MGTLTATAPSPVMQEAGRKAWITRRANVARASKASTRVATPKAATPVSDRSITLAGTRKLRVSVPTLVARLNSASSVEYYYGSSRSVIVVNS